MTDQNPCATCGDPLPAQTGRGRRRVAHEGHCTRLHNRERDEDRRNDRLRETLARPIPWAASRDDALADVGEASGDMLGAAGFALDEPTEAKDWREWRDKLLADANRSTFAEERRKATPAKAYARDHDVTDCYGCPLFDAVAVVASVTTESLVRGWAVMQEDAAEREAANGLARLMSQRPA